MVAGHKRMILPAIGALAGVNLAALAAVATPSGRGQSYDDWQEAEERKFRESQRRRYRHHYDSHVRDFEDYHHAERLRRLREEQERIQREKDAAHINAAEQKRRRKQAKRLSALTKGAKP